MTNTLKTENKYRLETKSITSKAMQYRQDVNQNAEHRESQS